MVLTSPTTDPGVRDRIRKSARLKTENGLTHLSFGAMATHCRASFAPKSQSATQAFSGHLLDWVAEFESVYSRFLPDSLISRINREAGKSWVEIDQQTGRLLQLCHEMNFMTRGVFDPTALPLMRLWNWKATPPVLPTAEAVERARELVGWGKVQRRPGGVFLPEAGMELDLGGIGKEYAVDMAVQLAASHGINDILVDFGRDIKAQGKPPERGAWHIGLDDSRSPGKCWAGLAVTNQAVATSGDYLRSFTVEGKRYGHIIDPRSGYPVANGCLAVSVMAPNCTLAGILSTTAFILGPQEGLALIDAAYGAEGCIVTENGRFPSRRFYEFVAS